MPLRIFSSSSAMIKRYTETPPSRFYNAASQKSAAEGCRAFSLPYRYNFIIPPETAARKLCFIGGF